MSLRLKIFGITVALTLFVIVVGGGIGIFLTQQNVIKSEADSLNVIADIAESLVSAAVDYVKLGARNMANHIETATPENLEKMLTNYGDINLSGAVDFLALSVVERVVSGDGHDNFVAVASTGKYPIPEFLLRNKPPCITRAFAGESVGSSTVPVGIEPDGKPILVFYICVPIPQAQEGKVERILCAALDGMFFADLLERFHIWDREGDIVLIDGDGTILASIFRDTVIRRTNYIEEAKTNPGIRELAKFFNQMLSEKPGHNVHVFMGQKRIGYCRPVSRSARGWALAVTAPAISSPYRKTVWWVVVAALISLTLGCIIAFFASGLLVRPYEEAFRAKERAERASESKSNFLATMSHEMRTPLNAIIGLAELAIGSDMTQEEILDTLEKIYYSGTTLLGTINGLLDISKIEAGRFDLIPVEYDMASLINDTAALNSVRIGSKPIQFMIDVDENLPYLFYGDELRIKQMINNLLSNAFKYTQEGRVHWTTTGYWEGERFFITFKVSDTGIGIREKDMAVLFKEYHQLDSKANRNIEGTGLGLALVRKIAGLMGGSISVTSEYGKGSTFTLRIQQRPLSSKPIGKDTALNLAHMRFTQSKLARNAQLTRLEIPYASVLVVDDVQTNLDVTKGMLKPYKMHVDCATSGQQAIDAVRNNTVQYNAIFMDHMMPGMDGIEAAQKIREIGTEYAKTVPIIALTANAIVGNDKMFMQKGFQAFLSKPIDIFRLDAEIRRWVRDKSLESSSKLGLLPPTSESETPTEQVSQELGNNWKIEDVDKEAALARFGGNESTYLTILQSYVVNTPALLDKIGTCTEENLPDYAISVHGIKGTSYSIGADKVGKLAESLEQAARQGGIRYISRHNDDLIKATEELIERIKVVLKELKMIE